MNQQPYGTPPQWWAPKMTPWWVRLTRGYRIRQLRKNQRIERVRVENAEVVRRCKEEGAGVLITPNHSAHYDSAALYLAADTVDCPLYFMTAWQVFGMSSTFECWAMQHLGCFSVDREGSDRQAFKQAVGVLRDEAFPLVIFAEGDVYHTTDRVTPFREGAAAIAISAAKKADRPIYIIPCGIKFWYLDDPTEEMLAMVGELENRLYLRPDASRSLRDRIHRVAEAALALKELDYLGHTREGLLRERVEFLLKSLLARLETQQQLKPKGGLPERAKAVRQSLIQQIEDEQVQHDRAKYAEVCARMGDVFFVMQLFSYPGDYLVDEPSIERMAETIDKFEEDILQLDLPTVRGRREAIVRFGEPVKIGGDGDRPGRGQVAELTESIRGNVQSLVDGLNADRA
jgi:1-acyl-sn-glycerol-3-phosphate acyltransferase